MKIKLQDLVRQCEGKECWSCKLEKDMHCTATIGGLVPTVYANLYVYVKDILNRQKHYIKMRRLKYENKIAGCYKKLH